MGIYISRYSVARFFLPSSIQNTTGQAAAAYQQALFFSLWFIFFPGSIFNCSHPFADVVGDVLTKYLKKDLF